MVPELVGVKAQHCAAVLFTDYYSEVNGYRGFTKEVLFFLFVFSFFLSFFFVGVIILILRAFPTHLPYTNKTWWCCLQTSFVSLR